MSIQNLKHILQLWFWINFYLMLIPTVFNDDVNSKTQIAHCQYFFNRLDLVAIVSFQLLCTKLCCLQLDVHCTNRNHQPNLWKKHLHMYLNIDIGDELLRYQFNLIVSRNIIQMVVLCCMLLYTKYNFFCRTCSLYFHNVCTHFVVYYVETFVFTC